MRQLDLLISRCFHDKRFRKSQLTFGKLQSAEVGGCYAGNIGSLSFCLLLLIFLVMLLMSFSTGCAGILLLNVAETNCLKLADNARISYYVIFNYTLDNLIPSKLPPEVSVLLFP